MLKQAAVLILLVWWCTKIASLEWAADCMSQCSDCKDDFPGMCPVNSVFVIDGDPCNCCDKCVPLRDYGETCSNMFEIKVVKGTTKVVFSTRICKPGLECKSGLCHLKNHIGICRPYFTGMSYQMQCDRRGHFLPVECSSRHCWCVDQVYGYMMPNTKVPKPFSYRKVISCSTLLIGHGASDALLLHNKEMFKNKEDKKLPLQEIRSSKIQHTGKDMKSMTNKLDSFVQEKHKNYKNANFIHLQQYEQPLHISQNRFAGKPVVLDVTAKTVHGSIPEQYRVQDKPGIPASSHNQVGETVKEFEKYKIGTKIETYKSNKKPFLQNKQHQQKHENKFVDHQEHSTVKHELNLHETVDTSQGNIIEQYQTLMQPGGTVPLQHILSNEQPSYDDTFVASSNVHGDTMTLTESVQRSNKNNGMNKDQIYLQNGDYKLQHRMAYHPERRWWVKSQQQQRTYAYPQSSSSDQPFISWPQMKINQISFSGKTFPLQMNYKLQQKHKNLQEQKQCQQRRGERSVGDTNCGKNNTITSFSNMRDVEEVNALEPKLERITDEYIGRLLLKCVHEQVEIIISGNQINNYTLMLTEYSKNISRCLLNALLSSTRSITTLDILESLFSAELERIFMKINEAAPVISTTFRNVTAGSDSDFAVNRTKSHQPIQKLTKNGSIDHKSNGHSEKRSKQPDKTHLQKQGQENSVTPLHPSVSIVHPQQSGTYQQTKNHMEDSYVDPFEFLTIMRGGMFFGIAPENELEMNNSSSVQNLTQLQNISASLQSEGHHMIFPNGTKSIQKGEFVSNEQKVESNDSAPRIMNNTHTLKSNQNIIITFNDSMKKQMVHDFQNSTTYKQSAEYNLISYIFKNWKPIEFNREVKVCRNSSSENSNSSNGVNMSMAIEKVSQDDPTIPENSNNRITTGILGHLEKRSTGNILEPIAKIARDAARTIQIGILNASKTLENIHKRQ